MTTEQRKQQHQTWNIFSLKEYFDFAMYTLKEKMEDDMKAMDERHLIIIEKDEKSVATAKESMEHRMEGMNEFRQQLGDQAKTFVSKAELKIIENDIKTLTRLVYIGVGLCVAIEIGLRFMK
jgi:CRISPR/Cas system CMR subunit Cmr6 (Cas7 group RAMP superfamily)